jgi:S1-C subfamily serine protease
MADRRGRAFGKADRCAAVVAVVAVVAVALTGAFGGGEDSAVVPRAFAGDHGKINEIYDGARKSVLFVQARVVRPQRSPFGPRLREGISTGTGFVIDDSGSVVTNAHVVENARDVAIRVDENTLLPAEVVGADEGDDIALLHVDPDKLDAPPLPLGDSDAVEVGDPVLALGNPLGLEDTITAGIVSAKQRRITAPNQLTIENVIQTDAAVNPGNSGGPLLDSEGRVIGINSQIATSGPGDTGFIGIAFAVPVNTVKEVVPDLADDGKVERPTLGVTAVTLTPQLAHQLELDPSSGALVVAVAQDSAADDAGIRGGAAAGGALTGDGDVIVRVGDRRIASSEDLLNAIADLRPGDSVTIELVRDGRHRTVGAEL